ncbi:MAG: sigma 54-interacting transcriptional regulator [Deltaproteobacteria bacterium]
MLEINNSIISTFTLNDLLLKISKAIIDKLPFDYSSISLYKVEKDVLELHSFGEKIPLSPGSELPRKGSHVGWVFENKRILIANDLSKEQKFTTDKLLQEVGIASYIITPLISREKIIGTLNLGFYMPNDFKECDTDFLSLVSKQIALAVDNAKSHERIEKLKKQNELILNSAGEGIYGLDSNGITTFVNPAAAQMIGWELEELIGKPQHQILHHTKPDGTPYPNTECPIYAAFKDGKIHSVKNEVFWRKDGSSFPVEYVSTPIWEYGNLVGAVVVFRDVTNEKIAEEKLRKAYLEVERLKNKLQQENLYLQEEIKFEHNFEEIVGESKVIKDVLRQVEMVAGTDSTVLIRGETGTGKERIARAIHNNSSRRDRPLVKVNCPAIPSGLIESELFGHEKGAFTGALTKKIGKFELADGGTIFLDELGDLPLDAQAKLLRVLQEREFERVGSIETRNVDVRVIAATNRDLESAVKEGKFRADLYYRLNVFPIVVPALAKRKEDIPLLATYFTQKYANKLGKAIKSISEENIEALKNYSWPGNIRELENIVERAVIVSTGETLNIDKNLFDSSLESSFNDNELSNLEDNEREHIIKVLNKTKWQIYGEKGAAKILGINPSTLRSRMDKLGIKKEIKLL